MTRLTATFETTTGIVRVLVPGADDPYAYDAAVVVVGDEGTAIIKALTEPPGGYTQAHRTAILAALGRAGFRTAVWRRRKWVDGKAVVVDRRVPLAGVL